MSSENCDATISDGQSSRTNCVLICILVDSVGAEPYLVSIYLILTLLLGGMQDEISAPPSVASQCPLKKFKYYPTKQFAASKGMIGHVNIRSPWWYVCIIIDTPSSVISTSLMSLLLLYPKP